MASSATASLTLGSWSPGLRYPSRSACSTWCTSCRYVGTPEAVSSRNSIADADWPPGPAGLIPLSIVTGQGYRRWRRCQHPAVAAELAVYNPHTALVLRDSLMVCVVVAMSTSETS